MKKLIPFVALALGCSRGVRDVGGPSSSGGQVERSAPASASAEAQKSQPSSETITVLVTNSPESFCDGAKMDSDGYKKTLTQERSVTVSGYSNEAEKLRATLLLATSHGCPDLLRELPIRFDKGTVYIPPLDGKAGISITLCTCRPEVDVNLLRMPGVSNVVWEHSF